MESKPQNPEFRINPENFHPWRYIVGKSRFTATLAIKIHSNPLKGTLCNRGR